MNMVSNSHFHQGRTWSDCHHPSFFLSSMLNSGVKRTRSSTWQHRNLSEPCFRMKPHGGGWLPRIYDPHVREGHQFCFHGFDLGCDDAKHDATCCLHLWGALSFHVNLKSESSDLQWNSYRLCPGQCGSREQTPSTCHQTRWGSPADASETLGLCRVMASSSHHIQQDNWLTGFPYIQDSSQTETPISGPHLHNVIAMYIYNWFWCVCIHATCSRTIA